MFRFFIAVGYDDVAGRVIKICSFVNIFISTKRFLPPSLEPGVQKVATQDEVISLKLCDKLHATGLSNNDILFQESEV